VEGSSNNKYVEIFNGTGSDLDLTSYKIKLYANGATSATSTKP
jgi:predicted extracellular nuclease